jgi:hypothetical protein
MKNLESSVRGRELGRLLRAAQEKEGLNGQQLAALLNWTTTKLSRTLTGVRTPADIEVATFLGVCGVAGDELERALRLCNPRECSGLHLPWHEQWSAYLTHAREAVRLVDVQPLIIPWVLQTAEYTRALLTDGAGISVRWEDHYASRRASVHLLSLPRVVLLVHEWPLRTPIQDAAVMSEQLHHLLRISVRPSVSLRVVPLGQGVQAGRLGPFSLFEFEDYPPVLHREDHDAGVFLDDPSAVARYRSVAEYLDKVALDEQQSRDLISQIATDLYTSDSVGSSNSNVVS